MAAPARPDPADRLPRWGAAIGASLVALAWIASPTPWLEQVLDTTGIAALLPIAAPPVGIVTRATLALGGAALTAIVMWASLYSLFGAGGPFWRATRADDDVPTVRRADAHPDAPARRPLSIAELTRPTNLDEILDLFVATPAEHAIPHDLDTPLSALDPGAIPLIPREPVRPVTPLAPGERMRTFSLVPPPPARPDATAGIGGIEALLRRLGGGRATT